MPATFKPPVAQVIKGLREGVSKTHQAASIEWGNRVIGKTPRRTGRLRFGWNYSVGSPNKTMPPKGTYGERRYAVRFAPGYPKQVHWMNTVPYVRFREYGSDGHKVNAMVQSTIPDWPGFVQRAATRWFI